jgi:hypothetical protein
MWGRPRHPDVSVAIIVKSASPGGGEHSSYGSKDRGPPKRGAKPFIMSDWSLGTQVSYH